MMKNNIFLNLRAGIISLLFLMLIAASCESESNSKSFLVESADTIVLPANTFGNFVAFYQQEKGIVQYQLYPAIGYGMEVIFFNPDHPDDYNSYRFDSIRKLDPEKYVCANAMEISEGQSFVNFLHEMEFYRIRSDGEILDTLKICDKRINKEEYRMNTFAFMLQIRDDYEQVFLGAIKDNNRLGFNSNDKNERINLMQEVGVGVLADITDSSFNIRKEVGRYSAAYFQKGSFDVTFPEFIINKHAELLYYFPEIDSLFVTDIEQDRTEAYPLNIFKKNTGIQLKSRYQNILYDPYREQYYLTYLPPCDKKNEDGFLIDQSKRPWQLIMINKDFKVEGRLTFPDEYSKHYMMIGEKGIYVRNNKLSESNSEGQVSVLYEFKNK